MRRLAHHIEDFAFRLGAGMVGVVLSVSSGLATDLARDHMALVGTICGANPVPHCGWCYGAASLAILGLAAFAVSLAPGPKRATRS